MSSIVRSLPSFVNVLQGSEVVSEWPGLDAGAKGWAPTQSRAWSDLGRLSHGFELAPMSATEFDELEVFFHQVGRGKFAIVAPVERTHYSLPCGPLADGSRTTFPIPVVDPSDVTVFLNGLPIDPIYYTIHQAANLVGADGAADCSDSSTFLSEGGTASLETGLGLHGGGCFKHVSSTTVDLAGMSYSESKAPVVAGQAYNGIIWVLDPNEAVRDYKVRVRVFTDAVLTTNFNLGSLTWSSTEFIGNMTSFTPAIGENWATVHVLDSVYTDYAPIYIGGHAVCPGDYDTWHLPSESPGLVEITGLSLTAGDRITASATGKRISTCVLDEPPKWKREADGRVKLSKLYATETLEY